MRASGILLHISSLPSDYGIGTMGKEAYKFVDFLEEAHQTYWQILPYVRQAMEILHINPFQHTPEIRIS